MTASSHAVDVNCQNHAGGTALMTAAANGHIESVGLLIQAGADLLFCNRSGWNVLQVAAARGPSRLMHVLFERVQQLKPRQKRTLIQQLNGNGNDAFTEAVLANQVGCVKMLMLHAEGLVDASGEAAMEIAKKNKIGVSKEMLAMLARVQTT
eukprot:TRINITY_DN5200_c0_g1_i5.p1 TRINITY_DN5200_c0_g1~~TRINITY_DN5200_c0_g1_i5.p1  ORF type:complete len:152 (-),score=51.10 TRINITY_DN5200_c0_g1_i5:282-737(-)